MIDEINIFFINQNTLPQLKKRFGNLLKKKRETLNILQCIFFFYCYQRVVFSDIKSKTFIYVRKFKKVPTCLLFLKILNSNSTCPPLPLIQNRELFQGLNYKIKSIYRLIKIQSCLTYFLQSHSSTWFSPALIIVPLNAIHFFGITEYVWAKHK